ncbi:hypothetical protein CAC42_6640 [Sphaceloma murrayae]|uniref:Uncharacterized protein n=1 Tax=Sphaceloma murrayae TaxID=2082308 RepID=A0A2K1QG20_9PEZI|nr:hypothetical protein CAC42_6640 [Sphaceloma murrayae]
MTNRLRKTFRYPTDDSDSESDARNPEDELDDKQQEAIIEELRKKDEASTKLYRTLFTALPLLASIFFLPSIFVFKRRDALLSILSISSLGSTAYTLNFIPSERPDPPTGLTGLTGRRQRVLVASLNSPVSKYLPWMNGGLAGVLALFGVLLWTRGDLVGAIWAALPAAIYIVVMVARNDLVPLDIEGLERMRYEYKGA